MSDLNSLVLLPLPFLIVYALYLFPMKHVGKRRDYRRFGYLDTPFDEPPKAFGRQRYAVRRDGNRGHFRGHVISNNPFFYQRKRTLEARESEQEGMPCKVCGRPAENDLRRADGPVFREWWESSHVLFATISRNHIETEAFCHRHVPRDWDEE